MSRSLKLITLVLGMLLLSAATSCAEEPSAADILKQSYAAESLSAFSGRLRTTLLFGNGSLSSNVIVFRNGRRSRMEYATGPSVGSVIIDDGSSVITLDPPAKTAYVSGTPEAPEHLDLLLANYRPAITGWGKIAGRTCYVVRLEPRYKGNPSKKLWIDKTSMVALKTERYDSDGKLATSTEYTTIDFSIRPSSSLFTIPRGWKSVRLAGESSYDSPDAVRKAVGFAPLKPGYVPRGYSFDGYYIRETRATVRFAGLRYTNGLNTISVFERKGPCPGFGRGRGRGARHQGRGAGAGSCLLAEDPQARMLSTNVGDLAVIVVGDISETELKKMASSLK